MGKQYNKCKTCAYATYNFLHNEWYCLKRMLRIQLPDWKNNCTSYKPKGGKG